MKEVAFDPAKNGTEVYLFGSQKELKQIEDWTT